MNTFRNAGSFASGLSRGAINLFKFGVFFYTVLMKIAKIVPFLLKIVAPTTV